MRLQKGVGHIVRDSRYKRGENEFNSDMDFTFVNLLFNSILYQYKELQETFSKLQNITRRKRIQILKKKNSKLVI